MPDQQLELTTEQATAELSRVASAKLASFDVPAPTTASDQWLVMLERIASNPDADIAKLEKLMDLHERLLAQQARAAFDAAFSQMQADLPEIDEKGRIVVKGEFRSSYAKLEDILRAVRPVMARHGFGLRFTNHRGDDRKLRIVGILSHAGGHRETDEFIADPDDSGAKAAIQMNGSTRSYGQRYTTIALLGIATRGQDNDGSTSQAPPAPEGFDAWFEVLSGLADEGWTPLGDAWNKSKAEFKNYVVKHRQHDWNAMKARAQKVNGGA